MQLTAGPWQLHRVSNKRNRCFFLNGKITHIHTHTNLPNKVVYKLTFEQFTNGCQIHRARYTVAIANCLFSVLKQLPHIICCREVFISTTFNFLQDIIIPCTFHTVFGALLIFVCFFKNHSAEKTELRPMGQNSSVLYFSSLNPPLMILHISS